MDLPASEIMLWKEYYNIFPFPQERDDQRAAVLATTVANVSGKTLKKSIEIDTFMPDYLGEKDPVEKSLREQEEEDRRFGEALLEMQRKSNAT